MIITVTLTKKILEDVLMKYFAKKEIPANICLLDTAKLLGFHYATSSGLSISLEDLKTPQEKEKLAGELEKRLHNISQAWLAGRVTEKERFQTMIDGWIELSEDVKEKIIQSHTLSDPLNNLFIMAFSGARGNMSQVRQIIGMRGLMADQSGKVIDIPISSSFRQGLTVVDYIISAYGARKGVVDTALRTADAGYLTRRLVYIGQNLVIKEIDCKTTRGISKRFFTLKKLKELSGHTLLKIETISSEKKDFSSFFQKLLTSDDILTLSKYLPLIITYRSIFTCHSLSSICQKCYGKDLSTSQYIQLGEAVGVLAAQSIGEPGTQMTMRTFHTGGIFVGQKISRNASPFAGKLVFPANLSITPSRDIYGRRNFKLLASQRIPLFTSNGHIYTFSLKKGDFLYVNKSTYIPKGTVVYEPQKEGKVKANKVFRTLRLPFDGEIFFHRLYFLKSLNNLPFFSNPKNSSLEDRRRKILTNLNKFYDIFSYFKQLRLLEMKITKMKKKFFFHFSIVEKLKKYLTFLRAQENLVLSLHQYIPFLTQSKNSKKLFFLRLIKQINLQSLLIRRKTCEKNYYRSRITLKSLHQELRFLFEQFKELGDQYSSFKNQRLPLKKIEKIDSITRKVQKKKKVSGRINTKKRISIVAHKEVYTPMANEGSIWVASGKNFIVPKESALFFSSFFFKKKAFATLKFVTPIAGILKIIDQTLSVSNKISSFSIDLNSFHQKGKKNFTKIVILYKNLTYVDAHTTIAFLYICPLVEEKLYQAKISLWEEKLKINAITHSDIWSFALDPLHQTLFSTKDKTNNFLLAGSRITPTIIAPFSGKFLENDGFIFRYQKIFPIPVRIGDFFSCQSGEFLEKDKVIAYTSSYSLRNNDIIQGLPKIANLFESRCSPPYARLAVFSGFSCLEKKNLYHFRLSSLQSLRISDTFSPNQPKQSFPYIKNFFFSFSFPQFSQKQSFLDPVFVDLSYTYGFYRSFTKYERKALCHNHLLMEHSYVSSKKVSEQNTFLASYILDFFPRVNSFSSIYGKFFSVGQPLTEGNIDAQTVLENFFFYLTTKFGESYALFQSLGKIRFILRNCVQRIYISQGVIIANSHIELIIREMTSNLFVENGIQVVYQNSFNRGEYCRFSTAFHLFNSLTNERDTLGKTINLRDFDDYLTRRDPRCTSAVEVHFEEAQNIAICKKLDQINTLSQKLVSEEEIDNFIKKAEKKVRTRYDIKLSKIDEDAKKEIKIKEDSKKEESRKKASEIAQRAEKKRLKEELLRVAEEIGFEDDLSEVESIYNEEEDEEEIESQEKNEEELESEESEEERLKTYETIKKRLFEERSEEKDKALEAVNDRALALQIIAGKKDPTINLLLQEIDQMRKELVGYYDEEHNFKSLYGSHLDTVTYDPDIEKETIDYLDDKKIENFFFNSFYLTQVEIENYFYQKTKTTKFLTDEKIIEKFLENFQKKVALEDSFSEENDFSEAKENLIFFFPQENKKFLERQNKISGNFLLSLGFPRKDFKETVEALRMKSLPPFKLKEIDMGLNQAFFGLKLELKPKKWTFLDLEEEQKEALEEEQKEALEEEQKESKEPEKVKKEKSKRSKRKEAKKQEKKKKEGEKWKRILDDLSEPQKQVRRYYYSSVLHTYSSRIDFTEIEKFQKRIEKISKEKKIPTFTFKENTNYLDFPDYLSYSTSSYFLQKNLKKLANFHTLIFFPLLPFKVKGNIKERKYIQIPTIPLESSLKVDDFSFQEEADLSPDEEEIYLSEEIVSTTNISDDFYSFHCEDKEEFLINFLSLFPQNSFSDKFSKKTSIDWFFDLFISYGEKVLEKNFGSSFNLQEKKLISLFSFIHQLQFSEPSSSFFFEKETLPMFSLKKKEKEMVFLSSLKNPIFFFLLMASFAQIFQKKEKYLAEKQKELAFTPLILGITSASLVKNGFLASAAFQEPKRILAKASILGECEWFEGLKESVIAGKLMPGGSSLFNLRDSLDNVYYYHPK